MSSLHFHIDNPHIEAEIYYLTPKEGGRRAPVSSGYRGQFHIQRSDWDAIQEFIDKDVCYPGESVKAYLKFATVHKIMAITEGISFEIREGAVIVGRGIITKIIDRALYNSTPQGILYNEIDNIIWTHWDPIGVNQFPGARDEYYSYLPRILGLLLSKSDRIQIADYLFKIETDNMGRRGNYDRCLLVTDMLLKISK